MSTASALIQALPLSRADHLLCAGALGRAGGAAVVAGLIDVSTLQALAAEAFGCYASASRQVGDDCDVADGRGGAPPRSLTTAGGAPIQDALYASAGLRQMVGDLCGVHLEPSGNRASYSYYLGPGDFLELHLDIPTCDLTLITVLDDSSPPDDTGGSLHVLPEHVGAPLGLVRQRLDGGALLKARPGQTVALLGGLVPHRVLPMPSGQRLISALCFRAVA